MGTALRSGAARPMYWRFLLTPSWHSARRESYHFIDAKMTEHPEDGAGGTTRRQESFLDLLLARYPTGRPADISLSAFKDELLTYIMCVLSYSFWSSHSSDS